MNGMKNLRFSRSTGTEGLRRGDYTAPPELPALDGLPAYYQGLFRVAKPVDANPDYGDSLGYKIKPFLAQLGVETEPNECVKADAKSLLLKSLRGFRPSFHPDPPALPWIACGKTRNNLREFAFLKELLRKHGIREGFENLALKPTDRTFRAVDMNSHFIAAIGKYFRRYCDGRERLSGALFYQLVQYTRSYINWKHSLPFGACDARLAIVANDHSPGYVAFAMRAKELGIARLYLQHAEVSKAFPALDFELSVLRNRASLDIYAGAGPVSGKAFILPREKESFDLAKLRATPRAPVTVGLYLTSRMNFPELARGVELLLRNPSIGRLFVKPHPAMPRDRLREAVPDAVPMEAEIPACEHIAVVCNSSVVVELLHRGVPVYQIFGMDPVLDDYYGFVRTGIAPRLGFEQLTGEFWRDYAARIDERWLRAFARLDPTADTAMEETETAFVDEIRKYLRPRGGRRAGNGDEERYREASVSLSGRQQRDFDSRFLRQALESVPYAALNVPDALPRGLELTGREHRVWNRDELVVLELESLFDARSRALPGIFEAGRSAVLRSAALCWTRLKDAQWTRRDIPDRELDEIFDFVLNYEGPEKVRARLEKLLFAQLMMANKAERLAAFFRQSRILRADCLDVNRRIELLKMIRDNRWRGASFENLADHLSLGLSEFNRMKLDVLTHPEADDAGHIDHETVENRFLSCAPEPVAAEFRNFVKLRYDALRPRLSFMDVRYRREQRELFYRRIRHALKHEVPFSLIRLGDGEGYIFEGHYRFFTRDDARNRERHWWGQEIPEGLRAGYLPRILDAVSRASVLGIPSVYRFLRDHTDRSRSLAQSLQGRGLLEVLNGIMEIVDPETLFSEDRCNIPLFKSLHALRPVLEQARRVVVISSARESEIRRALSFIPEPVAIPIPTHFSRHKNGKYTVADKPLPFTYPSVIEVIHGTVRPGDLVMVSGGVIGKVFIQEAKNRGAVALDIGGALDEWIGAGVGFHY
jgi:hypothetical protein